MPFDPAILTPNPDQRKLILEILDAALAAVEPYQAVCAAFQPDGDSLSVKERTYDLSQIQRIFVVGAGIAAAYRGGFQAFLMFEGLLGYENLDAYSVTVGFRGQF